MPAWTCAKCGGPLNTAQNCTICGHRRQTLNGADTSGTEVIDERKQALERLYWCCRGGGYGSDEYAGIMEEIERTAT